MLILSETMARKVLSLRDNSIGEEGTWTLMDSLIHNTTVKKNFGSLISTVHSLPVLKWTVEWFSFRFLLFKYETLVC